MVLEFKKRAESSESLKSFGTVASIVGLNGTARPTKEANFADHNKRVNITLTQENGDVFLLNCSKPVSADLRSKKLSLTQLMSLSVLNIPLNITNPETGDIEVVMAPTISYEANTDSSAVTITVTKAMLGAEAVKRTIDWESLVAL
jgi:hypothetical protein